MPWTAADAKGKTSKADTPKKQKVWASVANGELARCKKKGEGDCEGRAVRVANAAVAKMGEALGAEFEQWFDQLEEDTQGLLLVHTYGLRSALESERSLRKEVERRLKEPKEITVEGDFVALTEKSVRKDGTIPVKIIAPGWGRTGYYPAEVLERDGPKMFPAGTKMFWDHQTDEELAAQPEGSLRDLAAELVGDARWESSNPLGAGLYSDAKVFNAFKDSVEELAPHIGVSILGMGKAKHGEAEGREGPIIQEIAAVRSVDFVTMPGAGGQILQLFESARAGTTSIGEDDMKELEEAKAAIKQYKADLEEAKEARIEDEKAKTELTEEVAKFTEASLLREAKDFVSGKLAKLELPDMTRDRLVDNLSKNPPVEDGKIDEDAYAKKVEETVKAEAEYLAKVTGSGVIKGMGATGDEPSGAEKEQESLKESFKVKFENEGISPEEAEKLAEFAARGR